MNVLDASIIKQRADVIKMSQSSRPDLHANGLKFIDVDRSAFRGLAQDQLLSELESKIRQGRVKR